MKYLAIIVAVFSLAAYLWSCVPSLSEVVLRPSYDTIATPLDHGFSYERIEVFVAASKEIVTIVAWHVPVAKSKKLVIVVPGIDHNKSYYMPAISPVCGNGYSLLMYDRSGFGESGGIPNLAVSAQELKSLIDWAAERYDDIVLFGVSLGAPIALYAAAHDERVRFVLCEGMPVPESNIRYHTERNVPLFFSRMMSRAALFYARPQIPETFDVMKWARRLTKPIVLLHSPEDDVCPFEDVQKVAGVLKGQKLLVSLEGGHIRMVIEQSKRYQKIFSVCLNWATVASQ